MDKEIDRSGIWYGIATYLMWGFMPIYLKQIKAVPSFQILLHRIVWSFVLLIIVLFIMRGMPAFLAHFKDGKVWRVYGIAAFFLGINWFTYIWAVNHDHIIDSSLGYYINPLVSVALSVLVLKERLRVGQWLAISLAAIGVLYLTLQFGKVPWIALVLAFSFGLYGLMKKLSRLGSLQGLTMETAVLFLPALVMLIYYQTTGVGVLGKLTVSENFFLSLVGVVTAAPLLTFASAARRIPLSMMGILQYLSPTVQLLVGVLLYHESLSPQRLTGFLFVWAALFFFWLEAYLNRRRKPADAPAAS